MPSRVYVQYLPPQKCYDSWNLNLGTLLHILRGWYPHPSFTRTSHGWYPRPSFTRTSHGGCPLKNATNAKLLNLGTLLHIPKKWSLLCPSQHTHRPAHSLIYSSTQAKSLATVPGVSLAESNHLLSPRVTGLSSRVYRTTAPNSFSYGSIVYPLNSIPRATQGLSL